MEYTTQKPNFCPKCGTPVGSSTAIKENNPEPDPEVTANHDTFVPNITKIDCEISSYSSSEETLGSTIGRGATGEIKRKPYVSRSGDVVKDSIDFCRSSRSKDIDEGAT